MSREHHVALTPAEELRAAATLARRRGLAYPAMDTDLLVAVASWLDLSAGQYEEAEAAHWQVEYHLTEQAADAALAVARAIPGGWAP